MVAALLVLPVALVGLPLMQVFPESSYLVQPGYGAPIFALEMATSLTDVDAVVGPPGDPVRAERIAAMNLGNKLDFFFLVFYSAYMAAFFVAVYRSTEARKWLLVVGVASLAGIADAIENLLLLALLSDTGGEAQLGYLPIAAWTKFFAIAVCLLLAGRYMQKSRRTLLALLGWVPVLAGLSIALAFYAPAEYGWVLEFSITAAWLAMLVYSSARAVNARRGMRR